MVEPAGWSSSVNFTFIKDKSKYDAIKGWTESGYANFNEVPPEPDEEVTPYEEDDLSELNVDYGEQASETSSVKSENSKKVSRTIMFKRIKPAPQYKHLLEPEEFFS